MGVGMSTEYVYKPHRNIINLTSYKVEIKVDFFYFILLSSHAD
jgi:hypothetical protein